MFTCQNSERASLFAVTTDLVRVLTPAQPLPLSLKVTVAPPSLSQGYSGPPLSLSLKVIVAPLSLSQGYSVPSLSLKVSVEKSSSL